MFTRRMRKFSSIFMVLSLIGFTISGSLFLPKQKADAAVGDVTTYDFSTLPMNTTYNTSWDPTSTALTGWNVNFNYDWAKPQLGMRVIPSSQGIVLEPINGNSTAAVNGEYVRMNFEVPNGGWYNIDLTYYKYLAGSTCDILIDGNTIKSAHSFYSATQTSLITDSLKLGMKLEEGRHTITFKCTGTVRQTNNLYYNYLYLKSLRLTQIRGTSYKFNLLPSNNPTVATWDPTDSANSGYNPDWCYGKASPARGLRLVSGTFQLINQASTAAVNGEFITVNFDVPEGGTYNLYLTSFKNIAGGTARIKIDETVVKSSHSFYSSSGTSPATESLVTGINLSKGIHEITFELLSTVRLASNNLYYGYLYLTDLQVELTQSSGTNAKTRSAFYNSTRVNAARQNVASYDWAATMRDEAVAIADPYLAQGYDFIWDLPTAQSIPRGYAVNQSMGCLNCGSAINEYGNYPYLADPINTPWKLECPNCHYKFPTNDYDSFYKSGLDHHGVFNAALADNSYLVNTLYPSKGTGWGVDNGSGYVSTSGDKYTFVAYYNHWHRWYSRTGSISSILTAFKDAYIYTGDIQYARAGSILLDRIADLYPAMDTSVYLKSDGYLNSDGGASVGKIVGCIWETFLANNFCMAYDAFFPAFTDIEVINYLSAKNNIYNINANKYTASGIRQNIEDGIIKQIYPGLVSAQIRGNSGMHQAALASAAVAWDTLPQTKIWLDFDFKSGNYLTSPIQRITGGNLNALLVEDVDKDGAGNEGASGYNNLWLDSIENTATILDNYDLYPAADLYQNTKFRKMFYQPADIIMSEKFSAQYGDSGTTGGPSLIAKINKTIKAFEKYDDPFFAQVAYLLNGKTSTGLYSSIFTPNAEAVAASIQSAVNANGQLNAKSQNLAGTGIGILRDYAANKSNERDVWMYYGNTGGHGQRDALNLGMFAFGLDVLPELGYPEYADPKYPRTNEWEKHTLSHNTILVDKTRQPSQVVGTPMHFDDSQRVKLMDIEAPDVYSQTSLYKRTTAMIKVDDTNSYAVDFFRVIGGTDHHFSFHAAEGPVTTSGLSLVSQKSGGVYVGSYAGATVDFGVRPSTDSVAGSGYTGPGFHWLKNVDRASSPSTLFSADWDITDTWGLLSPPQDAHLRLTMLGSYNDVALADGIPPQNKPGNPTSIKYLVAHKTGTNLNSLFTSVIEPYVATRYIQSISAATVKQGTSIITDNTVKAVKVVLTDGRTDYIISAVSPTTVYTIDDRITFKGSFGVYSEVGGVQNYAYVNEGSQIGTLITTATPKYTGTVSSFTNTLAPSNSITVSIAQSGYVAADLVGKYIYISNDNVKNAIYQIKSTSNQSGSTITLNIGDLTPIREYKDSYDFSKGYTYDFAAGAAFTIPLSKEIIQ